MATVRIDGTRLENTHNRWSARVEPVAEARVGDTLEIRVPDASTGQLTARSRAEDLARLDYSKVDAAVGPVRIEGAQPGDTLEVALRSIEVDDWGWSGVFRKFGFLQDRFDDDLALWAIRNGWARPSAGFLSGVRIPVRPMLGIVGVAPSEGEFGMIPPQPFGGNMDNRLVTAGAVLEMPVFAEGALLSVGDPHASQGDGEVCGTGIETGAAVSLGVSVRHPQRPLASPRIRTVPAPPLPGEHLVAMGIAPDLREATRLAVENMLDALADLGFDSKSAYALLSVAGDLRLSEVVDEPNYVVSMTLAASLARRDA